MTGEDWSDSAEFRAFAREVETDLLPKLLSTSVVVSLMGGARQDVKFAVETGLAVLLDKPIVVVVRPGTAVPEKMVKVADLIIEADMSTRAGKDRLAERLNEFLLRDL